MPEGHGEPAQLAGGVGESEGGGVQELGLGVEGGPRLGELGVVGDEGALGVELPAPDPLRTAGHQLHGTVAEDGGAGGSVEDPAEPDAVLVRAEGHPQLHPVHLGVECRVEALRQVGQLAGVPVRHERGQVAHTGRGLLLGDQTVAEQIAFLDAERGGAGDVTGALRTLHQQVDVRVDRVAAGAPGPVAGGGGTAVLEPVAAAAGDRAAEGGGLGRTLDEGNTHSGELMAVGVGAEELGEADGERVVGSRRGAQRVGDVVELVEGDVVTVRGAARVVERDRERRRLRGRPFEGP